MIGLHLVAERNPGFLREVRGKGLMIGIEFDTPDHAEEVQWACFQRGLLVLECGKQTVRLCPPLVASGRDVETALRIFGEAVEAVATHPAERVHQAGAGGTLDNGEVDA